jgi:type VI protein secretion system component VasK
MSDEPKKRSHIYFWNRLGTALALFAVSIALWAAGTEATSGDPRLNPNLAWLTFLSPLVAVAATTWTLAIIWRRDSAK